MSAVIAGHNHKAQLGQILCKFRVPQPVFRHPVRNLEDRPRLPFRAVYRCRYFLFFIDCFCFTSDS